MRAGDPITRQFMRAGDPINGVRFAQDGVAHAQDGVAHAHNFSSRFQVVLQPQPYLSFFRGQILFLFFYSSLGLLFTYPNPEPNPNRRPERCPRCAGRVFHRYAGAPIIGCRHRRQTMGKLTPRYSPEELARLSALLKPVEKWTANEHRLWDRSQYGFRHFLAANIVPIEHFKPEPIGVFEKAYGRDDPPPRTRRTTPPPPRKPAA